MTAIPKLYLVSTVALLFLDSMWPGVRAGNFSRIEVGELPRPDSRWAAGWLGHRLT